MIPDGSGPFESSLRLCYRSVLPSSMDRSRQFGLEERGSDNLKNKSGGE